MTPSTISLADANLRQPDSAGAEWRRHWLLVLVACVGGAVPTAHYYSLGLFFAPLQAAFGWTRAQISLTLLVSSMICVALAPVVGMVIDRWGSRRIAIPGLLIYASGLILLALSGPSIWSYWASAAFLAFGQACLTQPVWVAAVAGRFAIARGLAIAVTLCGASLGSLVVPIIAQIGIDHYGWRAAYVLLALILGGIALPLLLFCFPGQTPAPAPTRKADGPENTGIPPGLTWREGLRSPYFWCLAGVGLFITSVTQGLLVHFVPIVTARGLDRESAAVIVSTIGIASMAGRLGEGFLLDRFRGPLIGSLSLLMPLVASLLIHFYDGSVMMASLITLALGLSLGAETNIVAYLATRYLGMRNYGVLFGILAALINLGAGIGPVVSGAIYDRFGSYGYMLLAAGSISLLFSIVLSRLGRYPTFGKPAA